MSVNKVVLIGNLGKDPDIRSLSNGDEVASFSLATSESWKDKTSGEKKQKSEWHNIVVFGGLVQIVKSYVKKGSKLYVEGKLQTRKWQDQSGADRYSTEVVLQGFSGNLQLLDSNTQGGYQKHNEDKSNGYQPQEDDINDSVPF